MKLVLLSFPFTDEEIKTQSRCHIFSYIDFHIFHIFIYSYTDFHIFIKWQSQKLNKDEFDVLCP